MPASAPGIVLRRANMPTFSEGLFWQRYADMAQLGAAVISGKTSRTRPESDPAFDPC